MMEGTPDIKCIFFSEFHTVAGPKITYQVPEDYLSKEVFDSVHVYIITKPDLQNRVITINTTQGHRIVGCPVTIDHPKYARNALIFNLCFVFEGCKNASSHESTVKKLAAYFTSLEQECGFLSNEESKATLPSILQEIRTQLNLHGKCNIPINESNTIHLKMIPCSKEPPKVHGHDVPIFVLDIKKTTIISQWDVTTQQTAIPEKWDLTTHLLLPYIDGFNHVARIAVDADVDIAIVKACIQNLIFHGIVDIISIFQYSNMYTVTPEINRLSSDKALQDQCINYVAKHGQDLPCFRDVFLLYCGLNPGTTVRDLCARHNPHALRVDERKLIQFGLLNGFIRRLHKYPVKLPNEPGSSKLRHLYRWFNGCHSYDKICTKLGMTYQELDDQIESDPSIVVCWK